MFKYLWIIMLVVPIVYFIYYTANAICDAIDSARIFYDSSKNIKWILSKAWDYFKLNHEILLMLWIILFIFGAWILFMASMCAYVY